VRRIFARILPNLPEKTPKKWPPTKSSSFDFGRHLFQIKACWVPFLLIFSGSLLRFSEILPGFYGIFPDFHQIKSFGGVLAPPAHPHLLHQCISILKQEIISPKVWGILMEPLKLMEHRYMFCGTPVEEHWPRMHTIVAKQCLWCNCVKNKTETELLLIQNLRFKAYKTYIAVIFTH